jgi:ketosteroid isomerase-like protein
MREIPLVFALGLGWMAPAFAQRAEIEAANAKWIELFNKGDFAGVAALYTADASTFPFGSPIVRGRT